MWDLQLTDLAPYTHEEVLHTAFMNVVYNVHGKL